MSTSKPAGPDIAAESRLSDTDFIASILGGNARLAGGISIPVPPVIGDALSAGHTAKDTTP